MKSKLLLFLLLSTFGGLSVNAQITFQKTFGGVGHDEAYEAQQTTDGGYILGGWAESFGQGNSDFYLVKTNAIGDTLWTKTYGWVAHEKGYALRQTSDSGYIIAGYANGSGPGSTAFYVVKTNSTGDTLWSKYYGGTGTDEAYAIKQTTNGGFIITGMSSSFGAGDFDVYLVNTDANGNMIFAKTYGGLTNDVGYSVQQTTDGGYIVAGSTNSFGAGDFDAYLIKTDSAGAILWNKTYGGSASDKARAVQQTTDGGYIVAGYTYSFGSGIGDVYLIKSDANGDTLWTKTYGGFTTDGGYAVQQTTDGGYIVAGRTFSFGAGLGEVYLIKTNSTGDTLWTRTFGGATSYDYGYSVHQTTDGGYIIGGVSDGFGASYNNFYMIKTDANGNSGCNQSNTATIVAPTGTLVNNPTTLVSSGAIVMNTNTFVGNGSATVVITLCTSVGINENTFNNSLLIYPNPFTNELLIKGTSQHGVIIIFDITGKEIMRQKSFNVETKINTDKLLSGFYLLNYSDGNKTANTKLAKF